MYLKVTIWRQFGEDADGPCLYKYFSAQPWVFLTLQAQTQLFALTKTRLGLTGDPDVSTRTRTRTGPRAAQM